MKRLLCITLTFLIVPRVFYGQENKNPWTRLLPHHAKLQFAGGIGFISGGVGYQTQNRRLNFDAFYGFVPEGVGGIEIHSVTAKLTWTALKRQLSTDIHWQQLTAGLLLNYAFGDQYFFLSPENYPLAYYGIPTAAHLGLFIGTGIQYRKIGAYIELGTTDRSLASYIRNVRSLPITDILNIAVGIKLSFRDRFRQKNAQTNLVDSLLVR
jgi:hypothetical protein